MADWGHSAAGSDGGNWQVLKPSPQTSQEPGITRVLHDALGPDVGSLYCTSEFDYRIWGGAGEELWCSTVALASIELLAKSSPHRICCGTPLGVGRTALQAKK